MRMVGEAFVADDAVVTGDVTLGPGANIWFKTIVRGDVAPVRIGANVNIQDGCILHCRTSVALELEDNAAVGHGAIVHGRRIGAGSLVGIRATVLDDCEIGESCLIAAGTLLTPGTVVPDGMLAMGSPGRVTRPLTDEERDYLKFVTETYQQLARDYVAGRFKRVGG